MNNIINIYQQLKKYPHIIPFSIFLFPFHLKKNYVCEIIIEWSSQHVVFILMFSHITSSAFLTQLCTIFTLFTVSWSHRPSQFLIWKALFCLKMYVVDVFWDGLSQALHMTGSFSFTGQLECHSLREDFLEHSMKSIPCSSLSHHIASHYHCYSHHGIFHNLCTFLFRCLFIYPTRM